MAVNPVSWGSRVFPAPQRACFRKPPGVWGRGFPKPNRFLEPGEKPVMVGTAAVLLSAVLGLGAGGATSPAAPVVHTTLPYPDPMENLPPSAGGTVPVDTTSAGAPESP